MKPNRSSTSMVTQVAIAVAAIIVGGYSIYIVSSQVPLPGVKYTAMAPYLSLIMAVAITYFEQKNIILVINAVFALIMTLINPYMGLAIFLTGLSTQGVYYAIPDKVSMKVNIVAASYSAFVAGIALQVSKLLVGSEFYDRVSPPYIFGLMAIAFVIGLVGAKFGIQIGKRVKGTSR